MSDTNEVRECVGVPPAPGKRPWVAPAIAEEEIFEAFALACSRLYPTKGCAPSATPTNKL